MAPLPTITASYGTTPLEMKASAFVAPGQSGIGNPEHWLVNWGGSASIAGGLITPSQAMQVPTVAACVTLISSAIGALPAKIYRADDKLGGRVEAPEHPAFPFLAEDANDWTEAGELRAQLVIDALLNGSGYGLVQRDGDGKPVEIIRLRPGTVSTFVHPDTLEPVYRVTEMAGLETVSYRDMLHVRCPLSLDGVSGISPIWHARESIGLALALERHAGRIMSKGARPSGILSFPGKMQKLAIDNVRSTFEAQHVGDNAGKPAVLAEGATWAQTEFKSVDQQFMEQRSFQIHEIARAFNVPPTLIGDLAKATLSNSEQMGRQFLTTTLAPWINTLLAAYRRTMIEPGDRKTYSIDFDTSALLRPDSTQRAAYAASMRAAGVMTANELRRPENLPDRSDGDTLTSPHVAPTPAATPDNAP